MVKIAKDYKTFHFQLTGDGAIMETGRIALRSVTEAVKLGLENVTILLPNMVEILVRETQRKLSRVTLIHVQVSNSFLADQICWLYL